MNEFTSAQVRQWILLNGTHSPYGPAPQMLKMLDTFAERLEADEQVQAGTHIRVEYFQGLERGLEAGREEGRREMLREIALLPRRIYFVRLVRDGAGALTNLMCCHYCGAEWISDYAPMAEHPANDCLWLRAQAALASEPKVG